MSSKERERLARKLYSLVPDDGAAIGNEALHHQLSDSMRAEVSEAAYLAARDALVAAGKLVKGKGRGGSVRRASEDEVPSAEADDGAGFSLAMQQLTSILLRELIFESLAFVGTPFVRGLEPSGRI